MEGKMKDRVVLSAIIVAVVSVLVGFIGKVSGGHFFVANATWHAFAQTSLLFAIAWGIGKGSLSSGSSD